MDAYRVIRYPGDEDEGARWACRARQQQGIVEIGTYTRGPASLADLAVRVDRRRNLPIPPLVGAASRPANARVPADDGRVVRDFKLEPTAREV